MKKFIKIALLLVAATCVSATLFGGERKKPFLTIETVRVKGPAGKFVKRLNAAGFYTEGTDDGDVLMVGTWEDLRGTRLRVIGDVEGNVQSVSAYLPVGDDWHLMLQGYEDIVARIGKKYGNPREEAFLFGDREGVLVNDTAKVLSLIRGTADVHSEWILRDGAIRVSLRYGGGRYYVITDYIPEMQ